MIEMEKLRIKTMMMMMRRRKRGEMIMGRVLQYCKSSVQPPPALSGKKIYEASDHHHHCPHVDRHDDCDHDHKNK